MPPSARDKDEYGEPVYWRYDILSSAEIDPVRKGLSKSIQAERSLHLKIESLRSALQEIEAKVKASTEYVDAFNEGRWKTLSVDFDLLLQFQSCGAAHYLRNTDGAWWRNFTRAFSAIVRREAKNAPARLALRHPESLRRIKATLPKKGNVLWDYEAAAFLTSNSCEFGNINPRNLPKRIRDFREEMRLDDIECISWFEKIGYKTHPYRVWIQSMQTTANESEAWYPLGSRLAWNPLLAKRSSSRSIFEGDELRLNELSWCLSREHASCFPFTPLRDIRHAKEYWERHRLKWWSAIEAAQSA